MQAQIASSTLFKQYSPKKTAQDTGSCESQIALWSHRIQYITEHLKIHKKDYSSRLGLIKMVGRRKKLLRYLQGENIQRYRAIRENLSLR